MLKNILITKVTILFIVVVIIGCNDDRDVLSDSTIKIDVSIKQQFVTLNSGGTELNAVLVLPEVLDASTCALVVAHGSGGMWVDNEPNGVMAKQFRDWADSIRNKGYIGIFVDSYSTRGVEEFKEVPPPDNALVAPEFIRPRDEYVALKYLQSIVDHSGIKLVNDECVGLVGFSHGGSTVLATLADTYKMQDITQWQQRYEGKTYPCPPPITRPLDIKFKFGLAYYPGCFLYSYFGNPTNESGFYINYAPLLIIAADEDPLFTGGNTEALVATAIRNGAGQTNNSIRLEVMTNANHSFDGKSTGDDGIANAEARRIAWDFIGEHFANK